MTAGSHRRPSQRPRSRSEAVVHERLARTTAWHATTAREVLEQLGSSTLGLSSDEATRRLARYGPNRLRVAPPIPAWKILIAQFRGVVVILLAIATAVAALTGERANAIAIAIVLVLNAALGFATELRARRAMEALRALESPTATVIRDGSAREIPAAGLVPGDLITVEAGQSVPADARLIDSAELRTVEASLTGEPMPVEKDHDDVNGADAVLAERTTMLFQGTSTVRGAARAVVVATGDDTEVGRIGVLTASLGDEPTPLERRLDDLGRRLVWVALGVAAVVAGMSLARGESLATVVELGVALAVAAVPEGLPAVATVALAIGVWRLARRRALVRRLPAVETLGSVTVICTDKTGTLTAGEMTATTLVAGEREIQVEGAGYAPDGVIRLDGQEVTADSLPVLKEALQIGALVNRADVVREGTAWRAIGDPTEAALIVAAAKGRVDRDALRAAAPEIGQVPFSSERQWMATFHQGPGGATTLVKGAPGRVIALCTREMNADGTERPLDDAGRARLLDWNTRLARRGLRVLGLALGPAEDPMGEVRDLTFVALVGIADPPATGVSETIRVLRAAGIRTMMLTGDQKLTATAVAHSLTLVDDGTAVLDGKELAALDDEELADRLAEVGVLCRVSPADKLRVVAALQHGGQIVAMLGDGVNDAAALRKADIGVAMGIRGTDVAKDAADMVLADDRFATIGAAVEEGRVVVENIRKFVFYLFSCNLAEVVVLFVAGLVGGAQLLTPLQILWLNLATDTFPALALAVEPAEPGVMRRSPRDPHEAILSAPFLWRVSLYAVLIAAVTLGAVVTLDDGDPARGRTVAFMTLALAQGFHLGNARSRGAVLAPDRALANPWAIGAVIVVIGLQGLVVAVPALTATLQIAQLSVRDWAGVLGFAVIPGVAGQLLKLADRLRVPRSPTTPPGKDDRRPEE